MRNLTKVLVASAAAASLAAFASTASAAIFVNNWTISPTGEITVTFGDDALGGANSTGIAGDHGTQYDHVYTPGSPAGSGDFTDTFDFFLPRGTVLNAVISTSSLTFTGITFNGVVGNVSNAPGLHVGNVGSVAVALNGQQELVVTGNGVSTSGWSGTATFTPAPEPAEWALMIIGFGSAGAMLRRRRAAVLAA